MGPAMQKAILKMWKTELYTWFALITFPLGLVFWILQLPKGSWWMGPLATWISFMTEEMP